MFDRVFQSSTTQEQVYNACAQKIVKGECLAGFYQKSGKLGAKVNKNSGAQKPEVFVLYFRCSWGIQWDNFCIWADVIWQNTHHGGKSNFRCSMFKRSCFCWESLQWIIYIFLTYFLFAGASPWHRCNGHHPQDSSRHLQLYLFHGWKPGVSYQSKKSEKLAWSQSLLSIGFKLPNGTVSD